MIINQNHHLVEKQKKNKKNRGKSYLDRKVALLMDCERNLMKVIKL